MYGIQSILYEVKQKSNKTENNDLKDVLKSLLGIEPEYWALGRLLSEPAPPAVPLWGLFILDTNGNLHFVSFDQDNWFSAIVKSGSTLNQKSSDGIKLHLIFSFQDRESLRKIEKRAFFFFFQKSCSQFHLKMKNNDNNVIFELEDLSSEFLGALTKS